MAVRDESNFLAEYAALPDEVEVLPGLDLGTGRALLRRPAEDPPGARFVPSVVYSDVAGETAQLALYARTDPTERAPLVLFVHGGGWSSGHHFGELRFARALAARGCVTASATYRFADESPWPASLEDVRAALVWLRAHAQELGADPDRVVLCGDSAGGHLVALAALRETRGRAGQAVRGVFLRNPAVDLQGLIQDSASAPLIRDYFGAELVSSSPLTQVVPGAPAFMTVTGDVDPVTPLRTVLRFHEALREAGIPERLEVLEGRSHGFDLYPADSALVLDLLTSFVEATVGLPVLAEVAR